MITFDKMTLDFAHSNENLWRGVGREGEGGEGAVASLVVEEIIFFGKNWFDYSGI